MQFNPAILLVFAAGAVLSFLLSGMEAGVLALSRLRIRRQMRAGKASARVLHGFLENPENFLWTILVGNTIANFVILGLAFAWLHNLLGDRPGWLLAALAALTFLFYTFCDLLPKLWFQLHPNRLCLMLARPFQVIHVGLRPLVAVVEWLSAFVLRWTGGKAFTGHLFGNREELKFVMQESAKNFTTEEQAMISRVLDLQSLTVRQMALPLAQAATVTLATPMGEAFALCRDRQFSRLPVWETKVGAPRITGILDLEPLIYRADVDAARPAGDFVKPALYLDEDLRLELALQRMQRSGERLAIVLGRDRREAGIVSLEDILKVVFGEVKL
jgi:CBS domain containing-hemolysin-like protein